MENVVITLIKSEFITIRKTFDRENRKAKREYQKHQQEDLHLLSKQQNTRDFWKSIGKLGISNERKQHIPTEIYDSNGEIFNR